MNSQAAPQGPKVEILDKRKVLDGFLKVAEVSCSYERFDGAMSNPIRCQFAELSDCVAAILFDIDNSKIIFTEQFRVCTQQAGQRHGWIFEAVAGVVRSEESATETLHREIVEETGYVLRRAEEIAVYFPVPGMATRRIHLFYAEVTPNERGESYMFEEEDVRLHKVPLDGFFRMIDGKTIEDVNLLLSGLWLRQNIDGVLSRSGRTPQPAVVEQPQGWFARFWGRKVDKPKRSH